MKPWLQLTLDEQRHVRTQMTLCGGQSVNGVAGWYAAQRAQKKPISRRKKPVRMHVTSQGVSVADTAPEPLEIEEIRDVLPN